MKNWLIAMFGSRAMKGEDVPFAATMLTAVTLGLIFMYWLSPWLLLLPVTYVFFLVVVALLGKVARHYEQQK
jgi:hypothetical protein